MPLRRPNRACTGLPLFIDMELSNQRLEEFKALYKAFYGEELSHDEALERSLALLQLVGPSNRRNENENLYGTD